MYYSIFGLFTVLQIPNVVFCLLPSPCPHLQCHGLWDEDDPKEKKEPVHHSESEDEENDQEESGRESEPASSLLSERRGSNQTLRSNNFGTSIDSGQILVHQPQQQTYQRRRSSSGASHISSHKSLHSSARSKRGNDADNSFPWFSII